MDRHVCYQCGRSFDLLPSAPINCPHCNSEFVERLEPPTQPAVESTEGFISGPINGLHRFPGGFLFTTGNMDSISLPELIRMVVQSPSLGRDPREYIFSDTAFQGLLDRLMGEGHCTVGMSDPALSTLKRERNSEGECIICQEQYQPEDETIRLDCGHLFHAGCVVPWLKKVASCPVCRFNVLKKE
ncbi:hypothetical protein PSACC_03123 [Paramicrosporidium saccamoebae]|uniref:RING-type E3 ubiquitin transferase n=1 Tax=Paramicrosporidium saccamoebae TaxID=1246581 RepID=A0A2H9TH82_9FUNG|nr:hypothetical protein PSACC_03123 [Paramicrosporidium saccamoebae]